MRLFIVFICFFMMYSTILAQQRPGYTQYVLNTFIINPAVAGIENYTDVKMSYHRQWSGIDGAPITTYLTVQGPFKKNTEGRENATSFHPSEENPRGKQYWKDYTATDAHPGFGITLLNDKTGPLNRFSLTAAYAYHLPIAKKMSLSAGIAAGVQNINLNTSKLYFGENNNTDPVIGFGNDIHAWKPDINAGLWLYSANFFAGIAAQNVIPESFSVRNNTIEKGSGRLVPHLFFTAGYRFLLTEDINCLPSVMIKYLQPSLASYDINLKLLYKNFFWAGASYSYKNGYAGMLGININHTFNISYSYDQTTSGLGAVSAGTHELLLGFLLGNNYGDWCPKNVW